jgi:hypothetical protein
MKRARENATLIRAHYQSIAGSECALGYARLPAELREHIVRCMTDPAQVQGARLVCREWNQVIVSRVHPRLWCPYLWRFVDSPLESEAWIKIVNEAKQSGFQLNVVCDAFLDSPYAQIHKLSGPQHRSIQFMFLTRHGLFSGFTAAKWRQWMKHSCGKEIHPHLHEPIPPLFLVFDFPLDYQFVLDILESDIGHCLDALLCSTMWKPPANLPQKGTPRLYCAGFASYAKCYYYQEVVAYMEEMCDDNDMCRAWIRKMHPKLMQKITPMLSLGCVSRLVDAFSEVADTTQSLK